ncbi:hypothetical protein G6L28_17995 [Agrobacterium larrymoorei]|uniref:hypothetical protein n=1 Tax=Agrobacterium larrymoorei TaxID=160699 RepID=UPI0015748C05|nr:hypothetical protein [Agrobacterium larrymoorei]NTJ44492.1 hypothetical protein [Agrobacterium larrymoorei]
MDYTLENLARSETLRTEFFEVINWVITSAKEKGFTEAAISHAKAKKRIQDELDLIINY